ncbi:MAG: YIP1 family protein [Flavobacterium sp.]|nr:MAG: YIP1 family protein [Flavobacterium sp.]
MEEYHIKDTYLSDQQVLNKIWLEPKRVFRFLNDYRQDKYLVLLLVLFGIQQALSRAESSFEDTRNPLPNILINVFLGALFGWLGQYIYALFIRLTGNMLGGKSDTRSILRVLAYSSIPVICSLVFFIARYMMLGNDIFSTDVSHLGLTAVTLNYLFIALQTILAIWTIVLCVVGISEIQKFSILKAIANLLMPALVLLAFALLLMLFSQALTS